MDAIRYCRIVILQTMNNSAINVKNAKLNARIAMNISKLKMNKFICVL